MYQSNLFSANFVGYGSKFKYQGPISIQETETGTETEYRDRDKNEFQFTRQSKIVPKSVSKICLNIFSLSLSLPPISIHHLELETETNFETNSETNSY